MLRHQKRRVGREQRQRNLDARIVRPAPQPQARPADADAVSDFADDDQRKGAGGLTEGKQPGAHRGDGKAVEDQGGRVVGEAFAFEHQHDAARQAYAADERERRDRIRRRYDGAEHEADGKRHAKEPVRRGGDRASGEDDAAERQAA